MYLHFMKRLYYDNGTMLECSNMHTNVCFSDVEMGSFTTLADIKYRFITPPIEELQRIQPSYDHLHRVIDAIEMTFLWSSPCDYPPLTHFHNFTLTLPCSPGFFSPWEFRVQSSESILKIYMFCSFCIKHVWFLTIYWNVQQSNKLAVLISSTSAQTDPVADWLEHPPWTC